MIAIRPGAPSSAGIDAFKAIAAAGGVDVGSTYVPNSYDAAFLIAAALEERRQVAKASARLCAMSPRLRAK